MMRSLFSGVAGLRNHQTRMDTVGNNIANVNTTGFKSGRVNFQDMLSQTLQGAAGPNGNLGGTNPMQVGLGMSIASMDTQFTDGALQSTGVPTDLAISGDGFFILSNGSNTSYTRDGSFKFDTAGNYVVPGTGVHVQGWMADSLGNINTAGVLSNLVKPIGTTMPATQTTSATFAGNLNSSTVNGNSAATSENIYDSLGNKHLLTQLYYKVNVGAAAGASGDNTWICKTDVAGISSAPAMTNQYTQLNFNTDGTLNTIQTLTPGPLGDATQNVTFKNLKLSTSTDPQVIGFSEFDNTNALRTFKGTFTYNASTTSWSCAITESGDMTNTTLATIPNITWNGATYLAGGVAFPNGVTIPYKGKDVAQTANTITITALGGTPVAPDGTIMAGCATEPDNATLAAGENTLSFSVPGANAMTVAFDRSKITQSKDTTSTVSMTPDGYGMGVLNNVTFDSQGVMTGLFSNNQRKKLGQVAMATFANNNGLMKAGNNTYIESNNSGLAKVGEANSGGRGGLTPAALEMSNVDLSQEFSNMIITQRGFQANSKIITTSDTMLEELVNLKR
ncbi:flagellar hook protein FlgE [Azotosporobacter soli]|uniref:flagellar hook protein FlgE n=1 Tax=Azotosporobacter soli TaxID=3055040 RepID=UPI0031FEBDB6